METRGVIAIGTQKKWSGVYNHSDSYPTGLGEALWNNIKLNGLDNVLEKINSDMNPITDKEDEIKITNKNTEPLFHEWIYVLNPKKKTMTILASVKEKGEHLEKGTNKGGEKYEYNSPNYVHELVDEYKLNDHEPDWEKVEALGDAIKERGYQLSGVKLKA